MKPIAVAFVAVLAITLAPACDWINRVDPTIKPLPGHCSEAEVTCYTGAKETGCCADIETCGGQDNLSCPAGQCCDIGTGGGPPEMMARRPHAQRLYTAP